MSCPSFLESAKHPLLLDGLPPPHSRSSRSSGLAPSLCLQLGGGAVRPLWLARFGKASLA
eukprot:6896165-Pyramimonas_sp.AAC.1